MQTFIARTPPRPPELAPAARAQRARPGARSIHAHGRPRGPVRQVTVTDLPDRRHRNGRHLLSFRSLMEGQWNRYGDRVDLKPRSASAARRSRNGIRT
jgi:hypothetical protein